MILTDSLNSLRFVDDQSLFLKLFQTAGIDFYTALQIQIFQFRQFLYIGSGFFCYSVAIAQVQIFKIYQARQKIHSLIIDIACADVQITDLTQAADSCHAVIGYAAVFGKIQIAQVLNSLQILAKLPEFRVMQSLCTYSKINIRRNIKNTRPPVILLTIQPTGGYLITGNCIENNL